MDWIVPAVVVGILLMMFMQLAIYASRYVKVGPNEALIVSGRQRRVGSRTVGYRIRIGGGTFVWPVLEKAEILSLEIMTLNIVTEGSVRIEAVALAKIKSDEESVGRAAERFLSKTPKQIGAELSAVIDGHQRAVSRRLTKDELNADWESFARTVRAAADVEFAAMGVACESYALRTVT